MCPFRMLTFLVDTFLGVHLNEVVELRSRIPE
jgi:hypothetical protein